MDLATKTKQASVNRDIDQGLPRARSRWPLHRGWNRVQGLRRALRNLAAVSEKQRSVDFVLCFCSVARSPGGGYPAVEDELGWLSELLAPEADFYRNSTRIYVKEKCGDAAMPGTEESLREALLPFAKVVEVTRVDDELRADDATAYLDHLAGPNYDDLAAWTFFLHADAPEHVHPFRLLEEVLAAVRSGLLEQDMFPFLYLSHNFLDLGSSLHTWDNFASPRLWKRLFGSSIAPPREAVKGYCCVQFLVPRRRALLRPRAWYATALAYFASEVSYFELFPWGRLVTWQDLTCRAPAQLWMPWWHVVFGEVACRVSCFGSRACLPRATSGSAAASLRTVEEHSTRSDTLLLNVLWRRWMHHDAPLRNRARSRGARTLMAVLHPLPSMPSFWSAASCGLSAAPGTLSSGATKAK
eukprot:s3158_g3.t1